MAISSSSRIRPRKRTVEAARNGTSTQSFALNSKIPYKRLKEPLYVRAAQLHDWMVEAGALNDAFLSVGSAKVLLDISSMPKRWFFPIVHRLMSDARVEILVVCYAVPERYGDQLAENPDLIRMLPGFPGNGGTEYDSAIVGIGFEPLGITSLFTDLKFRKTRLLFPFPPGPPGVRRNWMFVKLIEEMRENREIDPPDRVHIHTPDCPQIFDAICTMTEQGLRSAALAPYGPKPMSLAMCLYSLAASKAGKAAVPVYYGQPRRYALDYSTGIRRGTSGADIQAYCLKLSGRDLYTI